MKLAVALLLAAASSVAVYNIAECGKFAELAFDHLAFDRYDEFFRSDSTWTLASAGTYDGIDGIKEYVKFASEFSPFVEEARAIYEEVTIDPTRFDADTGTCVFLRARQAYFKMSAPAVAGLEGESTNYFLVKYEIEAHYVSHIELFLPSGVTEFWFTSAWNTDGVRKYVCEVMRDSCPATWAANGYDSTGLAKCVDDLRSLPMHPPVYQFDQGYADGFCQSCRFIHATFAAENEAHCPHISLVPIEDVNGKTVCQESALIPGLSMGVDGSPFTLQDKAMFDAFVVNRGIPALGFKIYPTVTCASAEEDCPVGLACKHDGGRRLRFGTAKTGTCVLAE